MKMIQKAIPLLLLWAVCVGTAQAITISVAPTNAIEHTLPDNIANAGDYYADTHTITTQSSISVQGVALTGVSGWKLYAKLEPAPTDTDITVKVRRTGSGSGGSISGGESFTNLGTSETLICTYTGIGDITGIPFEYQVSGVGVSGNLIRVERGSHSWRVKYRVEEIPS